MFIDIYTRYLDNVVANSGLYGTGLGDLFISTHGWTPGGAPHPNYKYDDASNGTSWDFGLNWMIMMQHPAHSIFMSRPYLGYHRS